MAYHIRQITTGNYYTENPSKPWTNDVEQSVEYETKREAKDTRREFIRESDFYHSKKSIHVTKQ